MLDFVLFRTIFSSVQFCQLTFKLLCWVYLQPSIIHSFKTFKRRIARESCDFHRISKGITSFWLAVLTITGWFMCNVGTSWSTLLTYSTRRKCSLNHRPLRSVLVLRTFHRWHHRFFSVWRLQWLFSSTATTICWCLFTKHGLFRWQFNNEIYIFVIVLFYIGRFGGYFSCRVQGQIPS